MSLADLTQSFFDLWHHFDGVEASRYDSEGPPPALAAFDAETTRQHGAAFRALAAAVEDLDLDRIEDEIDRTVLLDAIRVRLRRVDHERPERWNPLLWSNRLRTVLVARAGDADTLAMVPDWVERAVGTIAEPPLLHLELAREDLVAAKAALREESTGVEVDLLVVAEQAVDRFDDFLGREVAPDVRPTAGALGDDAALWRLHHDARLEMSPAEAERRLQRRQAELAAALEGAALPIVAAETELPDAVAIAGRHPSPIRRRMLAPEAIRGWRIFAREALAGGNPPARLAALGASFVVTTLGSLDLAIQTGRTPAAAGIADTAARLPGRAEALRELLVHPLEAFAAATYAAEWAQLFRATGDSPAAFAQRVGATGLLHPTLASWSFDGDGS